MTRARRDTIGLALFLGVCITVFLALVRLSGVRPPGDDSYQVKAVVPDAVSLTRHADVRQAGVRIGEVTELRPHDAGTELRLRLDDSHAPVYRDARVLVRSKSVAGENYVELDPGGPSAGELADGAVLPIDRADEATQIDQILSVLDPERRRQLQRALAGLGGGLRGRGGDVNRLFEASAAFTEHDAPVARILARERRHVARLVDSLGEVSDALGERGDAIRTLVTRSKTAAEAVATRDDQLRRTISELPGFLAQSRRTATRLGGFSGRATPVIRDLRLAVGDLVPAVDDLRPAARSGRATVWELGRFATAARPALGEVPEFAAAATRVVPPLAGALREINPLVGYLAPYWRELSVFLAQIGAATEHTDVVGHVGRIVPIVSKSSVPGVLTHEQERLIKSITDASGNLETRGTNAYPAPGEAGESKPFTGPYQQLEAEPPYIRDGG